MQPPISKNAVAAIRVSTTKQGTDSDSLEAQKEQIERYAENKGIVIKKFFLFLESASKEQQPMQEAVDYCKDPKNGVDLFIIKSIDRFTRGGSLSYDLLKTQLDQCGVPLVDTYGVISNEQINTLAHLGQVFAEPQIRDAGSGTLKGRGAGYPKSRHWCGNPLYANGLLDAPSALRPYE
jgi:DNA invertase Pin-like site-specific DNA recombinase